MSRTIRGQSDEHLEAVMAVLAKYEAQHPNCEIEAYRQNSASLRIRIVDPDFVGISRADRHNEIWRLLEELPEASQYHITVLLLLTPEEREKSFASFDFDDPIPSRL